MTDTVTCPRCKGTGRDASGRNWDCQHCTNGEIPAPPPEPKSGS